MALSYAQGRDCTELFESYHSLSDRPMKMMQKFEAKDQSNVPAPVFYWESTPFYDRLKERVRDHFGGEPGIADRARPARSCSTMFGNG